MDTGNLGQQATCYGHPIIAWNESLDKIQRIRCAEDPDETEFLLLKDEFPCLFEGGYEGLGSVLTSPGLDAKTSFMVEDNTIHMRITVKNETAAPVALDYLRLPLLMDQAFRKGEKHIFTKNVLRNVCLIGEGAYVTWSRLCGQGPMLVLLAKPGTQISHFYVDKGLEFNRMDASFEGAYSLELSKKGDCLQSGETRVYAFSLFFLMDASELLLALKEQKGVAVDVVPGMVIPKGTEVLLHVQSGRGAFEIALEKGDRITCLGEGVYGLHFQGYGQRLVRLQWVDGQGETRLPFFATEAIGDIYEKQAAFIAEKQFETDPRDPCFHGLLAWDLTHKRRVNRAFNPYDNWMAGGSDEIGLVNGVFLAQKNVYMPNDAEISVLCAFEQDFILDRLTQQPGYRVHRMVPWFEMFEPWSGNGADDVWRAYNYVHVVNIYYALYRIARDYMHPNLKTPKEYIEKAYRYAVAMFSYWMFPEGEGATHYGNMGESTYALQLEEALLKEGLSQEAEALKRILDEKMAVLNQREYPFASEMAYDTTAFEAIYAYALRGGNAQLKKRVIDADLATRGRHPVWHKYQVDIRQHGDSAWNASYMTQLGAWPLMDTLLRGETKDTKTAIAAYGAYLAGFSLYNAGGCWEESKENEGAMLWVLDDKKMQYGEKNKLTMQMSGEGPLGFYGALKAAASYRINHPAFGETGLGCELACENGRRVVFSKDGLGMRYIDLIDDWAVELSDGYINSIVYGQGGVTINLGDRYPKSRLIYLNIRRLNQWRQVSVMLSGTEALAFTALKEIV